MKKIIFATLFLAAVGVGCTPAPDQAPSPVEPVTQATSTAHDGVYKSLIVFASGASIQVPDGWQVHAYTADPQFRNYDLTFPTDQLLGISAINVDEWLAGPNPDEGYVIPHEDRPKALKILMDVFDHEAVTDADRKQFNGMAGEFLGYSQDYRADLTYVSSTENAFRGISFINLQGQDAGVYPVYTVTMYDPSLKTIITSSYKISADAKEVVQSNVAYKKINWNDPKAGPEIQRIDKTAHTQFKKLLETTARKDLSFGKYLDSIDAFFKTLADS